MKPLIDVTQDKELLDYSKKIAEEFTPSDNPFYCYNLENWTLINFYRRERNHMPAWQASVFHMSYVGGWFILAVFILLRFPAAIFGGAFVMISTTLLLYVREFVWKDRLKEGFVKGIPASIDGFIPELTDKLIESGYSFEEMDNRKSTKSKKPILLKVDHNEIVLLLTAWNFEEYFIVHIGRYPSNDWAEIGALRDLIDGLDLSRLIERDYNYVSERHH